MPTWKPPDGNGGSGSSGSGSTGGSGGSGGSNGTSGSGSSSGSGGSGNTGGGGGGKIEGPAWLPPGPHSPNTNSKIDPEVVYDLLGENPASCADTAKQIPAGLDGNNDNWRVLRGLAEACKAVQGQGGDWNLAASDYAALQGKLKGCKSSTAYSALGGILRFHGQHPSATVKLKASMAGGGGAVCRFRVDSVRADAHGTAKPGDTITVTVRG
ncbi:hypothetical protein, partial [Streptomyces sp. MBT53]|uniref:hypothetical protein n=1 Tax=Streptomyces sp. MBT53 TaxID=1488384 RepID=UPI001A49B691|nr:hypothetical protein [Streptomyces sp. MBT53]